jgi:hypothetical protein
MVLKIVCGVVGVAVIVVLAAVAPDIKRYMKIRAM